MRTFCFALAWLCFIHTWGCTTPATPEIPLEDSCIERRAAIDIGSGATRVKVAKVDFCQMRLKEILFEKQEKVSYQESLQASSDRTLSPQIIAEGAQAVKKLHAEALAFKPKKVIATASAAFREAKNGDVAVEEVSREAHLPVLIIDQNLEGRLGFLGAAQQAEGALEHVVVWDIGAGSQQMTVRSETGAIDVFKSSLASETFKEHLIEKIQHRRKAKSPNPISAKHAKAGTVFIEKQLADVPVEWRNLLQHPKAEVIGIGGVHAYSIKGQVGSDVYDVQSVSDTLSQRLNLTDAKVGGDFASTEISNLILVRGVMEALGIQKVRAIKVNLTDGAMVYPEFWK